MFNRYKKIQQDEAKSLKTHGAVFDYANDSINALYKEFNTSNNGLTNDEAIIRLKKFGPNEPLTKKRRHPIVQFLLGFANPLVLILITIGIFWIFIGEHVSALMVILMATMSVVIAFIQEYRAKKDAEKLAAMIHIKANVIRDGKVIKLKTKEIVPGDIITLAAGAMVPADLRIIEANDLFINEASLTGESFPQEKFADPVMGRALEISHLTSIAWMGSNIVSGTAKGLVIQTGSQTQFGKLAQKLERVTEESEFDRGVRKYLYLMIRLIFTLALAIFLINTFTKHDMREALIFSLAVAVGLAPEMLPLLMAINLSKGAMDMARKGVIVKRLTSMQNFGAMDILCTDKTGTLTEDNIVLMKHCNAEGDEEEDVLKHIYLNSYFQTGLSNVMDEAVLKHKRFFSNKYQKIDEIPFDFSRKIMSVVVAINNQHRLITKGAPEEIFKRITGFEINGKIAATNVEIQEKLKKQYDDFSKDGFRVLAIAYRDLSNEKKHFDKNDERNLTFKGFAAFLDPPKQTVKEAIQKLEKLGVSLKILSGDNELVTEKICREVNLPIQGIMIGDEVDKLNDAELREVCDRISVFVRLVPLQKERVIKALQANKHIVGYLGDGINDAVALKTADVGISVNNAVDVAKETADIILMQKNLNVLQDCVVDGRRTFANIVKYIKMGASSNFGNMFSLTGASIFLPFLPMRPIQIILNNFLYDISQLTIPTDNVDRDYLTKPKPWNIEFIKKFLLIIGPLSSIFDFITFGIMWYVFGASNPAHQAIFQTGWFIESLTTQSLIIYVIRTKKIPFLQSRPSLALLVSSLVIISLSIFIAMTGLGGYFGFVKLPLIFFAWLAGIVICYLGLVQLVKTWFVKKYGFE